jgi:hypothetical protein
MVPIYQRPKLTAGQERAVQLQLFSFLVKLRSREVLRVREAAEILNVSPDFIRDLLPSGKLETIELKAKGKKQSAPEYRITVRSFLTYIISCSSVTPEDWDDLLATFIDKLDPRSCDRVIQLAQTRRTRLAALK